MQFSYFCFIQYLGRRSGLILLNVFVLLAFCSVCLCNMCGASVYKNEFCSHICLRTDRLVRLQRSLDFEEKHDL